MRSRSARRSHAAPSGDRGERDRVVGPAGAVRVLGEVEQARVVGLARASGIQHLAVLLLELVLVQAHDPVDLVDEQHDGILPDRGRARCRLDDPVANVTARPVPRSDRTIRSATAGPTGRSRPGQRRRYDDARCRAAGPAVAPASVHDRGARHRAGLRDDAGAGRAVGRVRATRSTGRSRPPAPTSGRSRSGATGPFNSSAVLPGGHARRGARAARACRTRIRSSRSARRSRATRRST